MTNPAPLNESNIASINEWNAHLGAVIESGDMDRADRICSYMRLRGSDPQAYQGMGGIVPTDMGAMRALAAYIDATPVLKGGTAYLDAMAAEGRVGFRRALGLRSRLAKLRICEDHARAIDLAAKVKAIDTGIKLTVATKDVIADLLLGR